MNVVNSDQVASDSTDDEPKPERPCFSSDELFMGAIEITIVHAGEEYRLRVTSKGRLILTK